MDLASTSRRGQRGGKRKEGRENEKRKVMEGTRENSPIINFWLWY